MGIKDHVRRILTYPSGLALTLTGSRFLTCAWAHTAQFLILMTRFLAAAISDCSDGKAGACTTRYYESTVSSRTRTCSTAIHCTSTHLMKSTHHLQRKRTRLVSSRLLHLLSSQHIQRQEKTLSITTTQHYPTVDCPHHQVHKPKPNERQTSWIHYAQRRSARQTQRR